MKLYLAGPMTGYPRWNFDAFLAAAADLRAAGYDVVSPAEIELEAGFNPDAPVGDYTEADYHAAMRRDIATVLDVDGVALLPGWSSSRGARVEASVASAVGIPALVLRVWLADRERIQAAHRARPLGDAAVGDTVALVAPDGTTVNVALRTGDDEWGLAGKPSPIDTETLFATASERDGYSLIPLRRPE